MATEYKTIEWKIGLRYFNVKIRNVGDLNREAQIQMVIEMQEDGKRSKYLGLDIPSDKVNEFLEALK